MILSAKDKKTAHEIIEKGLQIEFAKGLKQFGSVLEQWEADPVDNRAVYLKLYKKVAKFDKHIAQRYEGMTDTRYFFIVAAQYSDGILTKEDLAPLSDEVRLNIESLVKL